MKVATTKKSQKQTFLSSPKSERTELKKTWAQSYEENFQSKLIATGMCFKHSDWMKTFEQPIKVQPQNKRSKKLRCIFSL